MGLLKNIASFVPIIGPTIQAYDQAKAAKSNLKWEAAINGMKAQIAEHQAGQAELFGKLNASILTNVGKINTGMIKGVSDVNLGLVNTTTDFNIQLNAATTKFNTSIIGITSEINARSAEGAATMIEAQGRMQGEVLNFNADLQEEAAQGSLERGNQQERVSRGNYAQLKGQQRARLAANGVALDEGSALRIQADTDYLSDVDADVIKQNAMREAFGYRMQGANMRAQATFASIDASARALDKRAEAFNARMQGQIGVFQANLEGATRGMQLEMDRVGKVTDIQTSSSLQILQNELNTKVNVFNTEQAASAEAWNLRNQAWSYRAGGQQAGSAAGKINPWVNAGATYSAEALKVAAMFI